MYCCREASEKDIASMVILLKELTDIEFDFDFNAEAHYNAFELLVESPQSLVIVAVNNETNQIIGMATGQVLISTAEGGNSLWIDDVIIESKYRKQGIGKAVLKYLKKMAIEDFDITRMQLCADINNNSALYFYEKNDWQRTHSIVLRNKLKR